MSALGDVLVAMPAVSSLRRARPDAHITWLVEDRHADLLEGFPDVDAVLVFERKSLSSGIRRIGTFLPTIGRAWRFVRRLRREEFDTVLDFQGNLKSGVLSRATGCRSRIGFDRAHSRELNHLFNNERVRPPETTVHRIDKDRALLEGLGIRAPEATPSLVDDPADRRLVDRFLDEAGLANRRLALLHPGTSAFGEFKRWPAVRFARLGDRIARELALPVLVTWGPGEEPLAREVIGSMQEPAVLATRTEGLRQAAALLRRGSLYVGADTGITHLAALLGVPTVALFGPKDPDVYAPRGDHVRVIVHELDCRPCGRRSCPFEETRCMAWLEENRVFDAARQLLSEVSTA